VPQRWALTRPSAAWRPPPVGRPTLPQELGMAARLQRPQRGRGLSSCRLGAQARRLPGRRTRSARSAQPARTFTARNRLSLHEITARHSASEGLCGREPTCPTPACASSAPSSAASSASTAPALRVVAGGRRSLRPAGGSCTMRAIDRRARRADQQSAMRAPRVLAANPGATSPTADAA
jgi:hypothetical protein